MGYNVSEASRLAPTVFLSPHSIYKALSWPQRCHWIGLTIIVPMPASELVHINCSLDCKQFSDFQPALLARLRWWDGGWLCKGLYSFGSKSSFVFSQPSSPGRPFNWLPLSIVWAGNAWLVMACTRTSSRSECCTQPSFLANRVAEWEALHRDYDWCSHANPTPPLIGGNLTPPTLPLDQPANDRVLSDYGQNWRQPHSPRCRQCGVLGGFVPQTRWREGAMQREWKVSWSAWTFSRYSLLLYLVSVDLQRMANLIHIIAVIADLLYVP